MNKTPIEYLDFSWNPIAMRCTPVSGGCAHCWHLAMANRLAGNPALSDEVRAAYAGKRPPLLVGSRLEEPLRRKKLVRIGVQFMGDLFHEDVGFLDASEIFEVMECTEHIYQVLTKRPHRMLEFVTWMEREDYDPSVGMMGWQWPENVWAGVTVENQDTIWRIDELMQIPAAVRFVSFEPLLGAVSLSQPYVDYLEGWDTEAVHVCGGDERACYRRCPEAQQYQTERLDWVICGPETGPGARGIAEFESRARSLRDQCVEAGVAFFLKKNTNGTRQLDGREWNEMPC